MKAQITYTLISIFTNNASNLFLFTKNPWRKFLISLKLRKNTTPRLDDFP